MPHLDAAALTTDPDGIDVLGRVLDTPATRLPIPGAFAVTLKRTGTLAGPAIRALRTTRRVVVRTKGEVIPEAV